MAFGRYGSIKTLFNGGAIVIAIVVVLIAARTVPARGAETRARDMVVLAFGDSLTAGYGLAAAESFPVRLEVMLRSKGHAVRVINAGVSGDTTAGGLARIDWLLVEKPDLVILELGANDGLRGVNPAWTKMNLDRIYKRIIATGARVLLTGMRASPSMGVDYETAFNAIFPALASAWNVTFYPFFLEGVAVKPAFTLPDGLHPNAKGVGVIVEGVAPLVQNEYRLWKNSN
ncbi:MAG: arylesterase [Rhodospirillaceae bacterium]|jgi:acyl-CoA thioesterase I|nr:arylesterase [Rhodospirillaceae bacterium]MBT5665328.1 arylesterase [Rhodospirillaceae bacterium]